ncbi:hypothetical protein RND71_039899 [Anisodus tanguticus]|uniref:At1g61320/AtMIF1 LRR domain-containing protein n=1 Tax=Anisodus tanguticus TaxID=243964 RepID=A0AAE1QXM5_9SOLA|nr:hypothetical protein RND71_039899 [Anisodus tanguticus]
MKKYLRWVNSTLQMCKGQRLDQFRVCFDLNKFAQHEIDKWLEFAFSTKVQILELDLNKSGEDIRDFDYCYAFPTRLVDLGDPVDSSSCIPHSNNLQILLLVKQNFKSLKVLLLKSVNVTGEILEFFLHNCPFLETMVVHGSGTLVNLEVVGKGLRLKNVPMLVEVDILGTPYTHLLNDISSRLSCVLSQLEVLTVHASLSLFDFSQENLEHYNFPELTKLKKFVLTTFKTTCSWKEQSLLGCTSIIRAAPQLKEFELQVSIMF